MQRQKHVQKEKSVQNIVGRGECIEADEQWRQTTRGYEAYDTCA